MDWEVIIQAIGAVIAAVVAISQITSRLPKSRTRLKHDLEILSKMDSQDPKFHIVKKHVDSSIERIYEPRKGESIPVIYNWGDFFLGISLLFIGFFWTISVLEGGFSWWSLLSGFVTLGGLGNILNSMDKESSKESKNGSGN